MSSSPVRQLNRRRAKQMSAEFTRANAAYMFAVAFKPGKDGNGRPVIACPAKVSRKVLHDVCMEIAAAIRVGSLKVLDREADYDAVDPSD